MTFISFSQIIYVARNPKDIVTSFFRLMQWGDGLNETDGTWDLFVDAFVSGTGKFAYNNINTY
jgi:hypothetical protein